MLHFYDMAFKVACFTPVERQFEQGAVAASASIGP
jgi:hypothetical protein